MKLKIPAFPGGPTPMRKILKSHFLVSRVPHPVYAEALIYGTIAWFS